MNEKETAILSVMAERGYAGEPWYLPFAPIAEGTGLDVHEIRRIVRKLARKGNTEFCRGLWTEDGQPAGSGYAITKAGRDALAQEKAGE